jgi:hypothetical protein
VSLHFLYLKFTTITDRTTDYVFSTTGEMSIKVICESYRRTNIPLRKRLYVNNIVFLNALKQYAEDNFISYTTATPIFSDVGPETGRADHDPGTTGRAELRPRYHGRTDIRSRRHTGSKSVPGSVLFLSWDLLLPLYQFRLFVYVICIQYLNTNNINKQHNLLAREEKILDWSLSLLLVCFTSLTDNCQVTETH